MKYLLLLGASLIAATPALAQEADADRDFDCCISFTPISESTITVTAVGLPGRLGETGQAVSVITAREIDSIGGADITRVLERTPGVVFSRNGGLGNFTGVRVRGAEAEQLLVLVDGVRVADVASPGGGFDFGNMLPGSLGKVELLRGSNSVVWGSQAIGGVLAATSRDVEGAEASAEYGANETVYATTSAGLKTGALYAGLSAGLLDTKGVSAAAIGNEADGYHQWQVSGRARLDAGGGLQFSATARMARSRLDIDGFPPPFYDTFDDTPEFQKTREWSGRLGARLESGAVLLDAGYALSDTRRGLFDPTYGSDSYYTTQGRSRRAELKGQWRLPIEDMRLDFGAERDWNRFASTYDAPARASQTGTYALLGHYGSGHSLAAGLRRDDHSQFGTAWTFGANGSVDLGSDLRLRASFGEGFKTPTLFQLKSNYGNTALSPERSRSMDLGIEKSFRSYALHFAFTLFRRDSRDLIAFISCRGVGTGICASRPDGTYDNIGKARAQGFELEGHVRPVDGLQLGLAYSYVESVNRTLGSANYGNDLARRPRHALSLSADWTPDAGRVFATTLGADVRLVSDSFDDPGNFTRLDGYPLLTLRASRPLLMLDSASQNTLDLYARIENVFAEHYQTAAGYGTPGRSAFVGLRAKF